MGMRGLAIEFVFMAAKIKQRRSILTNSLNRKKIPANQHQGQRKLFNRFNLFQRQSFVGPSVAG